MEQTDEEEAIAIDKYFFVSFVMIVCLILIFFLFCFSISTHWLTHRETYRVTPMLSIESIVLNEAYVQIRRNNNNDRSNNSSLYYL